MQCVKAKLYLTLNKPGYLQMPILGLSKVLLYKFHNYYIKSKHSNKSRLLVTDTDSLMYEIKTEDVYEHFSKDKDV